MNLKTGCFAGMHNSRAQCEKHKVVINLASGGTTKWGARQHREPSMETPCWRRQRPLQSEFHTSSQCTLLWRAPVEHLLKKHNTGIFLPLQRLHCLQNSVLILFALAEYSEMGPGPVNALYTSSAATFWPFPKVLNFKKVHNSLQRSLAFPVWRK